MPCRIVVPVCVARVAKVRNTHLPVQGEPFDERRMVRELSGTVDFGAVACGENRGLFDARYGLQQILERGDDALGGESDAFAQIDGRRAEVQPVGEDGHRQAWAVTVPRMIAESPSADERRHLSKLFFLMVFSERLAVL